MTDPSVGPDQAQLERIARLGRTTAPASSAARTNSPQRRRRRHPAQRSRIVAASVGATTMFGIVTALGVSNGSANPTVALTSPNPVASAPGIGAPRTGPVPATLPGVVDLAPPPVVKVLAPTTPPRSTTAPRSAHRSAPMATTSGSS